MRKIVKKKVPAKQKKPTRVPKELEFRKYLERIEDPNYQ
jgi:hypothetical protein